MYSTGNVKPFITIGLLTYNNEQTLISALDGLINQTYRNIEIIVYDDCSTDGTWKILEKYSQSLEILKIFRNKKNLGCYDNFKQLINNVNGEYFLWACPDDDYEISYLDKCLSLLIKNNQAVICTSAVKIIYDIGKVENFFYNDFNKNINTLTLIKNILRAKDIDNSYIAYNSIIHNLAKTDFVKKYYHECLLTSCEELWIICGIVENQVLFYPEILYIKHESTISTKIRLPCHYKKISPKTARLRNLFKYFIFIINSENIKFNKKTKLYFVFILVLFIKILPNLIRQYINYNRLYVRSFDQKYLKGFLYKMFNKNNKLLSFGKMPIANAFLKVEDFVNEYFFELAIKFNTKTKLLSLVEQPDPIMMFHDNYAFFSSTSKYMAQHFKIMAQSYIDEFIIDKNKSFVVELGSNDGIMLQNFAKEGIKHLGVEPSANVAEVARQNGVNTISRFFNKETALETKKEYGLADIICASNVMCHIPDFKSVAEGINTLLKPSGVFIFEDPYLGDVIQKTSYDQIYDEHVYIFSLQAVSNIFSAYNLEVFHVEPQITHGGSMRYYLCYKGTHLIRDTVHKQLDHEFNLNLDKIETYVQFAHDCEESKKDLRRLLLNLKKQGNRVVGYAATSKSTTVLNYCDIGPDLIEYICDTTPIKQDKFSPGMHIPIKSHEHFKNDNPDYVVLFAWNHAQEIFAKEQDFIERGGQWIVFVPEVKILNDIESIQHYVA